MAVPARPPPAGSRRNARVTTLLTRSLAQADAEKVSRYAHAEDRKRALASQLLQRSACARAVHVPFCDAELRRTKGGKPFLVRVKFALPKRRLAEVTNQANQRQRGHAPNFNFNVSHEGDWVVLASEPLCVCGVDVAAPGQLRRANAAATPPMREYLQLFARQFTAVERAAVLSAGHEGCW